MTPVPGRNDPCFCGSGRKYKKCHGALAEPASASLEGQRAETMKAADVALGDRLLAFARKRHGPDWLSDSLEEAGLLNADGQLADAELPVVIPWLLHFRRDSRERTLAAEWREQKRKRISPEEEDVLQGYANAWLSLWEVEEVLPQVGSRLRDVLTREERFVRDLRSTATLARFDTVLAIVVTCGDVSFFGGVHAQPLPPRMAHLATRAAKRLCRVRTRAVAPPTLRDPDVQCALITLWQAAVEQILNAAPPSLSNTDGHPFAFTKDHLELLAPETDVRQRLESFPGLLTTEREGQATVFVIARSGNQMHRSWDNTIIGRLLLSPGRLVAETNSTRRADSLRARVEAHLPGLVRFRLRTQENTEQLIAAMEGSEDAGISRPNVDTAPEVIEQLRQFREQHLRGWIDDRIPALGGLSPREAARTPRARPALELLLKELEQMEARLPAAERIDTGWLRETLDFP